MRREYLCLLVVAHLISDMKRRRSLDVYLGSSPEDSRANDRPRIVVIPYLRLVCERTAKDLAELPECRILCRQELWTDGHADGVSLV